MFSVLFCGESKEVLNLQNMRLALRPVCVSFNLFQVFYYGCNIFLLPQRMEAKMAKEAINKNAAILSRTVCTSA